MSRKIVTGAAGFIGSHLCEALLERGDEVVAIDRLSDYYNPTLKRSNLAQLKEQERFELVEGSLIEVDLGSLLHDDDVVFHLAGQPGVRPSWGSEFDVYLDDNVKSTQRLLEAAREVKLSSLVYASSSSIYGDAEHFPTAETDLPRPVSPYGVSKLAAEHLCMLYAKSFSVPCRAVRYFTIFGPRQRPDMAFSKFIDRATRDEPIQVYGDGRQSRDFTFVSDAVAATVAASERGADGTAYNVAGGNQATVLEVLEILERLMGREVAVEHVAEMKGDARRTGADVSRARDQLGYRPEVSLEEGLGRQLEAARGADRSEP